MPQLRKDPTDERWVIIATNRARRPGNFINREEDLVEQVKECPFCQQHETLTPPEIYAIRENKENQPGWKVRVIPSINPMFRIEGELKRRGYGMYDVIPGVGAHEVVIETPDHIARMEELPVEQIELVLKTFILRINDLEKDHRFKYVLAYKNYGVSAGGGAIGHTRSQLIATPVTPLRIKEELVSAKRYYDFHDRCLFCDMILQEIESKQRVVADHDHFLALMPFAARFPFSIMILPKKHHCDFSKGARNQCKDLAKILQEMLRRLHKGLNNPPYNFVIHTAPFRRTKKSSTQWRTIDADYHWHIEILPRLTQVAGFEKGSGFYINSIPPEDAAQFLREVEL